MLIKSPAKINIGLRIINKRSDGFHDLETIFYPVRLFDTLDIQITKSGTDYNSIVIKSISNSVPLNKNNTCFKIIQYFFQEFKIKDTYKFDIQITKNIPIGGGLGGGSSNAGSLLRYLIKYFQIDMKTNRSRIFHIVLQTGSDVPFFLIQKPCYATGRGENLSLLKDFHIDYEILLVNPQKHISTKWAFENLNFTGNQNQVLNTVQEFNLENASLFANDFEPVVFKKYPELKNIKNELVNAGAIFTSLSGTGAVIYGFFKKKDYKITNNLKREYKNKGWFAVIA